MKVDVHFSSKTPEWETPQNLFDQLNNEFGFLLDVCATDENAKCDTYFTKKNNGLTNDWKYFGPICWMNPPYGREISKWIQKASEESKRGCQIVSLLPARTDTRWFHDFIYQKENVEIRLLKGRLKFGNAKYNAPFPSMIVIFNPTVKPLK
jgi:site-specific DNA-methyltransferase (adenine-specific)